MSKHDNLDGKIEGQLTIEDIFGPPEKLIAVSKIFSNARKEMSLPEQKTFVYALSELKFKEVAKSNIVYLDKKTLAHIVGVNSDADHLSVDLHNRIKGLSKHSYIEISAADKQLFDSGMVINRVTMFKNRVRVKFDDEYLRLFTGLSTDYITMWSADIFQMQSRRSVQFYEYLRQCTDTRLKVNNIALGIKALKELFDIPKTGKGSYVREKGGLDRSNFEKKVIEPLCADLSNCRMINLVMQPDGKLYEKVKRGNRVLGYRFYWTFTAHPGVATAEEVKQIQERVDHDPEVLKVAKDILNGEKKQKAGKGKGNSFTNINQRDYDEDFFRQLEAAQGTEE